AGAGNIDVLIVSGANPVHTMPAASGFADALARVPMIVSLSSFMDDTTALAHVVLPSHTDLESWGDHAPEPGVGFRVAAISQPVVAPLFDTRPTGDIVLGLARELGLGGGLDAADMHEYIRRGWLDIYRRGGAADDDGFDEFWRSVLRAGVWGDETRSDNTSVSVSPDAIAPTGGELLGDDSALAFLPYLSHGFRDGRGANLPWMQELPDPMTRVVYGSWVELNPETARELGIDEGELVEISSEHGTISAPALIYPAIMPGVVAMPIGQGHGEFGRYARNRGANPLQIVSPDADAASGELAWSATRITLNPTGRRAPLLSTSGTPRDLGRDIVRTTGGNAHAKLRGIPITVERA
ncbi:MAG: molybdopterin dinucleotide binding domain-containing protein, partial [Woeseiaceae bacterium]